MTDLLNAQTKPQNANPWAASVRIKSRTVSQAYGQRRHDFRIGRQPNYVDQHRAHLNRILFKPRPLPDIRDEVERLRHARGVQRAMKSNAAIVTAGIITFGSEAAKLFAALTTQQQDAAYSELAHALAERLDTTLEALVHHGDETTAHAHFELRGVTNSGHPVSKELTRRGMSDLQDLTAEVLQRYCPDLQRGNRKQDRLDAGAHYPDTLNRSVRQLHEDLPAEIAAKEKLIRGLDADISTRQASIAKDQERVRKLEQKEALQAKEEKRLRTYRARIAKKVEELRVVQARQGEQHEALKLRATILAQAEQKSAAQAKSLEVRAAEADAMITEAKQARAEADTGLAAVEAIVEEMANDTIRETPEEIILENPAPILAAPKPVQKRLTKLVHRYLDLQIDWRKRSEWLGAMMAMVQAWLGRDDLPNTAKEDGEQIRREFDDGPDM